MADIQGHFCRKCGEKLKEIDKFCYKCGEKRLINDRDTMKEDVTTKVPLSLDAYKFFKKKKRGLLILNLRRQVRAPPQQQHNQRRMNIL